jgi:hypothetical protein
MGPIVSFPTMPSSSGPCEPEQYGSAAVALSTWRCTLASRTRSSASSLVDLLVRLLHHASYCMLGSWCVL